MRKKEKIYTNKNKDYAENWRKEGKKRRNAVN